jgi:hypothetical protein
VYNIRGAVFLESGDDQPKRLDPFRHNGVVLYANEVIVCRKGASCEIHVFEIKDPDEPSKNLQSSKDVRLTSDKAIVTDDDITPTTIELEEGEGYSVNGVSDVTSRVPPLDRREKVAKPGKDRGGRR